ncbi:hypothetical protein EB001_03300 [bacterium]|nr:hypothetical protein [bacterium]
MENIVFFNHWHYGDLFSTRGWVADIKRQLPESNFYYAHKKNPRAIIDLAETLDAENNQAVLDGIDQWKRFGVDEDTILINTWVGSYMGLWPNTHPSYISHHRIIGECYNNLRQQFGIDLKLSNDVWDYVPEIDYSKYNTAAVDNNSELVGNVYLFCNSAVASKQSSMDNMKSIIEYVAENHKNDTIVATEKFETKLDNIFFTGDIFSDTCDLCDISYLSTKVNLIVGKNSGPFTYANTKQNLLDKNKVFVNFSHKPEDLLPYGLDIAADFRFSNTTFSSPAVRIIERAIDDIKNNKQTSGYHIEK